jgi:hypothetical protein
MNFLFWVETEDTLEIMLKISQSPLPQSSLSYVAFRVAFRETFDRVSLNLWYPTEQAGPFGYLCQVPFLQEVAPAVQLDLLASTWAKHVSRDAHQSDLVDESVIYSACESTAQLIENEPETVTQLLRGGPMETKMSVDSYLARELRSLYLSLPNDGDFLIISQFLDIDPDDAIDHKLQMGIDPNRMSAMFDVLGRWHVSPEITSNLRGLLTEAEITRVTAVLRVLCLT